MRPLKLGKLYKWNNAKWVLIDKMLRPLKSYVVLPFVYKGLQNQLICG